MLQCTAPSPPPPSDYLSRLGALWLTACSENNSNCKYSDREIRTQDPPPKCSLCSSWPPPSTRSTWWACCCGAAWSSSSATSRTTPAPAASSATRLWSRTSETQAPSLSTMEHSTTTPVTILKTTSQNLGWGTFWGNSLYLHFQL